MSETGGWFWRQGFGGSGHYVPVTRVDDQGRLLAVTSSPCGRAQGGTDKHTGSWLERRPVFYETACYGCRQYARRHGIAMPQTIRQEVERRLAAAGFDAGIINVLKEAGIRLEVES